MARNQSSSNRKAKTVKEEGTQRNQPGGAQEDPSNARDVVVQKATALTDPKLHASVIGIILKSLPGIEHASAAERKEKLDTVIALLEQINPRDATEGLLVGQMIASHEHALECLRNSQYKRLSQKARFENLKLATRLLEIYRKQFQALSKYREGRALEEHQMMLEQRRYEDENERKERSSSVIAESEVISALLQAARDHASKKDVGKEDDEDKSDV